MHGAGHESSRLAADGRSPCMDDCALCLATSRCVFGTGVSPSRVGRRRVGLHGDVVQGRAAVCAGCEGGSRVPAAERGIGACRTQDQRLGPCVPDGHRSAIGAAVGASGADRPASGAVCFRLCSAAGRSAAFTSRSVAEHRRAGGSMGTTKEVVGRTRPSGLCGEPTRVRDLCLALSLWPMKAVLSASSLSVGFRGPAKDSREQRLAPSLGFPPHAAPDDPDHATSAYLMGMPAKDSRRAPCGRLKTHFQQACPQKGWISGERKSPQSSQA
jgi:hypothetical protein